jgi:hypothetical protein
MATGSAASTTGAFLNCTLHVGLAAPGTQLVPVIWGATSIISRYTYADRMSAWGGTQLNFATAGSVLHLLILIVPVSELGAPPGCRSMPPTA